ncbi:hypothetical protein [Massilia sp. TS11]|uniref:hypothetical protein n=1 Tax=Massilia sp. TS11 TaxID=2908003 RepID=UPI001EDBD8E3|nr:hypothetical protein [Massilia sp. TS11]MCG2586173.1 hypothetical protein [Massilia sp. TS11]
MKTLTALLLLCSVLAGCAAIQPADSPYATRAEAAANNDDAPLTGSRLPRK